MLGPAPTRPELGRMATPGGAAIDELADVAGTGELERGWRIDGGDGVADGAPLCRLRLAGDDDLVELDGGLAQQHPQVVRPTSAATVTG